MSRRRLALTVFTVLAVVASLAVLHNRRREPDEIRALWQTLDNLPQRPVTGRLSRVSVHAPASPGRRGRSETTVSPELRIAAARVEQRVAYETGAPAIAALGVAYLVLGDVHRAISALEDAIQRDPTDARTHNDLSVALLTRADSEARAEDLAHALASANRALRLDRQLPAALFNRALALSALHLSAEEREAWQAAARAEPETAWATEASARLVTLDALLAGDPAREREGAAALKRWRDEVDDRLLREWGDAVTARDARRAERALAEAERLAERLAAGGGDLLPRDEVRLIRRAAAVGRPSVLADLAAGHVLYSDARARYVADDQQRAADLMTQAAVRLRRAGSPYWQWETAYRAALLRNQSRSAEALRVLALSPVEMIPEGYRILRGRLLWMHAVSNDALGRFDLGRDRMQRAVAEYRAAGDIDSVVATETLLAEEEWFLGDRAGAWRDLLDVLALSERHHLTRNYHLAVAAFAALGTGNPEAALDFQTTRVRIADSPRNRAEAYLQRARTHSRLDQPREALADLDQAATAVATLPDAVLRARNTVDLEISRVEALRAIDCSRAVIGADAALQALSTSVGTIRRGGVLTTRAGCRQQLGDVAGARADLLEAIDLFEQRRATIATAGDRLQAFEAERAAFKALLSLQLNQGDGLVDAFGIAERSRAGVVAEAWPPATDQGRPLWSRLPAGLTIVYFESLDSRCVVWVLTNRGLQAFVKPVGVAALRTAVASMTRAIEGGASADALRPMAQPIMEQLIEPALATADRSGVATPTVVFVPDGPLFGLPFGALPDRDGHPLLESWIVAVAPSAQTFVAASDRVSSAPLNRVVAVGDGHDPAATSLPRLPNADIEAAQVAALYPTSTVLLGRSATRARLLDTPADVLHFAGHTVLNERYPLNSRLLLAPDEANGDSGVMFASDLTRQRFASLRVAVLATCEGASGRLVEGEGALSVAQALFSAGVPSIVASLWAVDDDLQTMMTTMHRELRDHRNAARALRAGRLAVIKERGPRTPVRAWGGFVAFGGLAVTR